MPFFTVETTYHLPVYRQRTYRAQSAEDACRLAIEDDGWANAKEDVETSGETYVTGLWKGRQAYSGPNIPIPERFDETVQRKADLFAALLALLREPAQVMGLSRHDFEQWLPRAQAVIAKADAIVGDTGEGS
ncbi:hypothetical protein [Brucella intermedia]|uniref:hypothetical protein n=1 Tax=Brucella intermedia TaxID=94625 RepID=UPI00224A7478|nr:hypothetical protein [Brucella intermedia]